MSYLNISATTTTTTTMMTTTESESTLCTCTCEDSTVDNITKLNERIASLQLPKSTLSTTRRKLTSADDQRPSAKGAGAVGVFVLVTFLAAILIFDLSRFCFRSKEWRDATFRKTFHLSPAWLEIYATIWLKSTIYKMISIHQHEDISVIMIQLSL